MLCYGIFVILVWLWANCLWMCKLCSFVASCLARGMWHVALEFACIWVGSGLSFEIEAFGSFLPVSILWGQEFSSGPVSWSQVSLLGVWVQPLDGAPILYKPHSREGKRKEKKKKKWKILNKYVNNDKKRTDRKGPKTNGNSSINQTGTHKEGHKHAHRKKE